MAITDDLISLGSEAPRVISSLVQVVKKVGPVLGTVRNVVDDPAFPQVIARIQTLHELEAAAVASTPGLPGQAPPTPMQPAGIGLYRALPVLDAVIFARRNPWAPWIVGGGFLLLIGGIGYRLGRRRATR